MKNLMFAFAALMILSVQASEIILMDSAEFNFIQHHSGRLEYAKKITPLLAQLQIRVEDVGLADSDQVFEALAFENRWDKVTAAVEAACKQRRFKGTCRQLAKARLDTFDYIKQNPESAP